MEREKNLDSLKKEIVRLKTELKKTNEEKEGWFKEKEEQKEQIKKLITEIRDLKGKKDSFNIIYQELKGKRDEYNKKVQELIIKVKGLNQQKKEMFEKLGIKSDSSNIKIMIDKLEEKIETEAMPFKKEKEIMEQIKKLKKSYDESSCARKITEEATSISKLIEENRKKAEEYHNQLKEHIKLNRGGYRDFISLSRQIEFLKSSQEVAFKTFLALKNKFLDMNRILKNKLFEAKKIKEGLNNKREEINKRKQEKEKRIIEEKTKEIEEKFKTTKKLTTEDLIILGKKDEP